MHFGVHEQLLLVGLLLAVAAMLVTAPLLRIPYPIFLVLGGLALGFMPGIPTLQLPPDVVLIAVLPPLLYASAFFTSLRHLRASARPTGMLGIGLVVGFLVAALRRRLDNPPVEVTIALMTGYLAFIPANAADASGVLAVVTAGIYLGWRTPELTSVQTRLQGVAVWEILVFVLNALLFALVGLQLSRILDALTGQSAGTLIRYGALTTAAVIGTRLVWAPVFLYLPKLLSRRGERGRATIGHPIVVAWSGMRGAVSLAAALAIPLTTHSGAPFPERDLIIFLTFCVILGPLVFQGLTLPVV